MEGNGCNGLHTLGFMGVDIGSGVVTWGSPLPQSKGIIWYGSHTRIHHPERGEEV